MNVDKRLSCCLVGLSLVTFAAVSANGGIGARPDLGIRLVEGFRNPPDSAKPFVWWHWINGCVTREGIDADLEAMKDAGIGGANVFFVGRDPIPEGPVEFLSREWFELVKFAVSGAKRRGLQIGLHNCPGWACAGGPWNTPDNAMKSVCCTVTNVAGPCEWRGILARPAKRWYRDLAVIAYPKPADGAKVEDFRSRLVFGNALGSKPLLTKDAVCMDQERDLTSRMSADGALEWEVPAGEWIIQRIGFAADSTRNHPAQKGGTGLECDKLSRVAVRRHWDGFMGRILRELGPDLYGASGGLTEVLVDSYELNSQNWTPGFELEFEKRRGYPISPYWPLFAGYAVGSVAETERFARDFRLTVSELWIENFAAEMRELAHAAGLKFLCEGYGSTPASHLPYSCVGDIPMCEFWAGEDIFKVFPSCRLAASAAHLKGISLVAAESFTSGPQIDGWRQSPKSIRRDADRAFCEGVTRFYFHSWPHQPWTDKGFGPGLTLGPWGMGFHRNQTWWPYVNPFLMYVKRCQWMLRQGSFTADVGHYYGDYVPERVSWTCRENPDPVVGYDWDYFDAAALKAAKAEKGKAVMPSGLRYSVIVLPERKLVSEESRARLDELKRGGVKVVEGNPLPALRSAGVRPDCAWPGFEGNDIRYIHRIVGGTDVYFVSRAGSGEILMPFTFRVDGKIPELWNAEDGSVVRIKNWSHPEKGLTTVVLKFVGDGSWFVVFRTPGSGVPTKAETVGGVVRTVPVNGVWHVSFDDPDLREKIVFEELADWTSHQNPAIRYYSGTAVYRTRVEGVKLGPGERMVLDLGEVREYAEVTVNRRTYPALWHAPFQLDVSDALSMTEGLQSLDLSIRVANLWPNRMIGDEQLPEDAKWGSDGRDAWDTSSDPGKWGAPLIAWPSWILGHKPRTSGRRAFSTWKHWRKTDRLLSSGLLGPVALKVESIPMD